MILIGLLIVIIVAVWLKSDGVQRARDTHCVFCGVCAGIGNRYGIHSDVVRILWVIGTLCVGGGLILYIVLWAILPQRNRV